MLRPARRHAHRTSHKWGAIPTRCPRLNVVDGINDVSSLREARGHDNAALSYVTFTGEDWLEERSSSVEGIWGH